MEEEAIQAQLDSEMEDWEFLLPDSGNTRSRMTLFKQAIHVYWVMKQLLAKALEQAATEMVELAQGVPNLRRELRIMHITLEMQDKKLEEIQAMIKEGHLGANREADQQLAAKVP